MEIEKIRINIGEAFFGRWVGACLNVSQIYIWFEKIRGWQKKEKV